MMNKNIALFPGTFDPITLGHTDIINRAIPLFDKLIIGIGANTSKKSMFTVEQRKQWIEKIFRNEKKIECMVYDGLTVNFCNKLGARYILRGIRFVADFEYEKMIADTNKTLNSNIETIILTCTPKFNSIASSIVRDLIIHQGNIENFMPHEIINDIKNTQTEKK